MIKKLAIASIPIVLLLVSIYVIDNISSNRNFITGYSVKEISNKDIKNEDNNLITGSVIRDNPSKEEVKNTEELKKEPENYTSAQSGLNANFNVSLVVIG